MDKKEKILSRLLAYAGKRKVLTYLSMVIAGISQLLALAPFIYIWTILRDVIAGDYSCIAHYGWMAVIFAIASIVVYFGGLMCSHLAAFRIAANMRKKLIQHIMTLPIGFWTVWVAARCANGFKNQRNPRRLTLPTSFPTRLACTPP